jgi:anthranilate phosphoribosyltransferase
MNELLERICSGESLSRDAIRGVFARMVRGDVPEPVIAALVTALKMKGETPEEVAGAADALLEAAVPFPDVAGPTVDTCGTGGDGAGTVNISTAVALVCAELGVKVAKHGNRSVSSNCGSADVLEQLGVRLDAPPQVSARCLRDANICFLFAPQYHSGVRHAMPVRRALGVRTIFNILGPLVNPARPSHQLLGVYSPELCEPMAHTLSALGATEAMVVHGSGLDEVAAHGRTTVAHLRNNEVVVRELSPEDFGVTPIELADLSGDGPQGNARWLRAALAGDATLAQNSAIAVNVAAVLHLTGRQRDLVAGTREATDALISGRAAHRLNRFVEMTHGTV